MSIEIWITLTVIVWIVGSIIGDDDNEFLTLGERIPETDMREALPPNVVRLSDRRRWPDDAF